MVKPASLILGPLSFVIIFSLSIEGLSPSGRAVAALTLWMAVWWLLEVVPLYVTALLPLLVFPALDVVGAHKLASSYGNEIIFLFLGGFLFSAMIEKSGLHRRLARTIIRFTGHQASPLLLGFMLATSFLSVWVSNTAAVLLMLPMTMLFSDLQQRKYLLLGIGYSASIGGLGSILGSPPNAIAVAYLRENHQIDISFLDWLFFGLPVAFVGTLLCWAYLALLQKRRIDEKRLDFLSEGDPWSSHEKRVLMIFVTVFVFWILRSLLGWSWISDTGILLGGVAIAFMVPTQKSGQERLLVEDDIRHVSLPILLLFGGGLALSAGFQESGLSQWLGSHLSVSGTEMIWVSFLSLSGVSVFLTELMSNTALASILVPIVGSLSSEPELVRVLVLLVAFSASLSFMLPMATPPNAIVFSKARMPMKEMMWIGFGLNLLFILFLSAVFALYASLFVV